MAALGLYSQTHAELLMKACDLCGLKELVHYKCRATLTIEKLFDELCLQAQSCLYCITILLDRQGLQW